MIRWLLILFWVVCVGFALFVARTSRGCSHGITVLEVYIIYSIIVINIGFLVCFCEISKEVWAETALISTSLGLGMSALGGLVSVMCFRADKSWSYAIPFDITVDMPYRVALTSSLIIFAIVLLYFYLLGYIPLLQALRQLRRGGYVQGLMNTLRVSRDPYVNPNARHIPLQGFMELIRYEGLPVVSVWFLWFYLHGVKPMLSLAMVVTSALFTILSGQRWPLKDLLVVLIIFYSWIEPNSERYWHFVWRVGKIAILAGVVLSVLLGRRATDWLGIAGMALEGAKDLFRRVVVGNAHVPFVSYRIFPNMHPWLLGGSWMQNLAAYVPGPRASFPVTFSQIVTGISTGFTAPPDFYTEAYINFGFAGVAIISFAWGYLLGVFQKVCSKKKPGLLPVSILALGTLDLGSSAVAGANALVGFVIVAIFINAIVWVQKALLPRCNPHVPKGH